MEIFFGFVFIIFFFDSQKKIIESTIYKNKIPYNRINLPEHFCSQYNLINHSKFNFVSYTKKIFPNYIFYSWIDFGFVRNKLENVPKNIDLSLLKEDKIIYQLLQKISNNYSAEFMLSSIEIYFMGASNIIPNLLVEQF